jgi:DNA-binding Xre family transcriptional regulator
MPVMSVDAGGTEIAALNQIRLDEDLSVAQLADSIGIDASTLHRLLFMPGRKPYDRTLHKIQRFLEQHKASPRARRRRVSA